MDIRLNTRPRTSEEETVALEEDQLDLRETLRVPWRRKWLIVAVVATITSLVALYAFTATPRYTAKLQVLFESKAAGPIFDFQAPAAGQPQDETSILSEIEVIKSRSLAERVIDKLSLATDPEFNANLRPKKRLPALAEVVLPDDMRAQHERDLVIDAFIKRIKAKQITRSRAVEISFTSTVPQTAAEALNSLAELYLVARLEDRLANAQRASSWLASRIQKLREQVEESEEAVQKYRRQHGLFEGKNLPLIAEQFSDLSAKLSDATIARLGAEANMAQVRRLLRSGDAVETATQVLQSDLIQRFREQELDLTRKEAEIGQKYGDRHPLMIQLRAEKEMFRAKVRLEIHKILRSLENDAQTAQDRENALSRDLEALKGEVARSNLASVGLHALQRDAEVNRLLLERFMTAFTESSAQEDVNSQVPAARIISAAPIPMEPSFPKTLLFISVALVASTVFCVLAAFAVENMDAGFRSAEQVESSTGLPVLAHVPLVKAAKMVDGDIASYVLQCPRSAYAEAIRALYACLLVGSNDRSLKVTLFISAEADEGKTATCLSLVRQQAQAGQSVLMLDTDFRCSRLAQMAGLESEPGLSELLAGAASREEVIQIDRRSGAHVIVAGNKSAHIEGLLGPARQGCSPLESLLSDLRNDYDLITIDGTPVLALADTHAIAAAADVNLMLVQWGRTRRRVVRYALSEITKFGGCVDGVVLSMVDVRKHASYGYGDSGYYYGKAARYYTS